MAKNETASPIRLRENSRLSAAGGAATSAASAASTSASSGLSSSTIEAGSKETTAARAKRRRLRKEHDDGGGDMCGRLPREKQHLAAIILSELNRKMGSVVWSPT